MKNLLSPHAAVLLLITVLLGSCSQSGIKEIAPQWDAITFSFTSSVTYDNPYTDVELMAEFIHSSGETIIRPAFWDGDDTWKIRFASPFAEGTWTFTTQCSDLNNSGLHDQKGQISCIPYSGDNKLIQRGLLRMSPGKRNVVHANGRPFLVAGDTPWALPFRGTIEAVEVYAKDRQEKGFNAALLMTLQPDRDADGPRDRVSYDGFDVAFEDLSEGHINQLNISYFKYFDGLIEVLLDHEIVPVYQPVFHGFGWKGMNVLGWNMVPEEYVRYTRYLIARYGAMPAMWLVGGDGNGNNPGVREAGEELESWDAYHQPTGIHYNPFDEYCPESWTSEGQTQQCYHENKSHQEEPWLDFQWCQTGHGGEHLPHKVMKMYENEPTKAVANGEPTYEAMDEPGNAAGWWQGHEAWLQFTSGGTMGHIYGAAGLWQWKLHTDEYWPDWANGKNMSWREAIELEGSSYVGIFRHIIDGYDITDIERRHDLAQGGLLLAKPGALYIAYLPGGGSINIPGVTQNISYVWYNPMTGKGERPLMTLGETFIPPTDQPWVLVVGEKRFR